MQPQPVPLTSIEDDRTGTSVETLKRAILDNLFYVVGKPRTTAGPGDYYTALAHTVRDRMLARWIATLDTCIRTRARVVTYLSAEFLLGPHLLNNIVNLGLKPQIEQAVQELGLDLDQIIDQEEEPGLGNGGLGRLAACFMDSLATLDIPAVGYGIRYEFGIFDQEIRNGWQVEITDRWLRWGNPWELRRPEHSVLVGCGGRTEARIEGGRYRVRWLPAYEVKGVPYDTPILGYGTENANLVRLWSSEASEYFHFDRFNAGDYEGAVADKVISENITKVLYPNDEGIQGKRLRLQQQYFLVSCALQDMLRVHFGLGGRVENFPEKWAAQMNDTHPSIGVAELMRLLLDDHGMDWEPAWDITCQTFAYTNHTLLPEALERWPLPMFSELLPRHIEIVYEINRRFLDEVRAKFPGDEARLRRMSIIDETGERYVRMAHLACAGSHHVNGVAALHSELLKTGILRDFYELWPEKFLNVTNGVTPRRWLAVSNPPQAQLMSSRIGEGWIRDLDELRKLEPLAADSGFRAEWRSVQRNMKTHLGEYIHEKTGITVDADSMFDVQVKRIHEYKRQHLNVLHILTLYHRIKANPSIEVTPRTFLFGGKAAPGYFMAKLIIKLINSVAEVVNADPDVRERLKVVFLPDYNVTFGQRVYPAADLSEQISTAGKEASGTGNMKFSMNGALTIGTLDGANIEIRDAVRAENFFLFGLSAEQVIAMKSSGYRPLDYYTSNEWLKVVLDSLISGEFSRGDKELFRPLFDSLTRQDEYMLLADYQSYVDCQADVSEAFRDQERWSEMAILNTARMGRFSSDRSIREYCDKIWRVPPVKAVPGPAVS